MEKLLLVLICILGIVMMVKGLIARFKYRLKATRCSLQAPGKIIDIKQDEHWLGILDWLFVFSDNRKLLFCTCQKGKI